MPNKISPESSDGLFRTPLELFSLEREGRPVAGRPFRFFMSRAKLAPHRFTFQPVAMCVYAPDTAGSPRGRARPHLAVTLHDNCFCSDSLIFKYQFLAIPVPDKPDFGLLGWKSGDYGNSSAARPVWRRAACFRCGMFSTQAKIYSGVERSDRINGPCHTRSSAISSLPHRCLSLT